MSTLKQYELVYIVAPEATDEQLAAVHTEVEAVVARFQGTLDRSEPWGRRKLAYPIGRYKEGIYVLEVFTAPGDAVKELDRRLKVADNIVRHLIVRVDEGLRIAERAKSKRNAQTARRRVARGLPAEPTPEEKMRHVSSGHGQDDRMDEAEA
jgi:small subunit ribosomal protein S6